MRLLSILALLLAVPLASPGADLTVVGSDLLGEGFARGVTDFARRTALPLKLELEGTRVGTERLQAGRADLGLFVFTAREKPPGAPFVAQTVAYHTAVVVVPADMLLTQITIQQLRMIYGDSEAQTYQRWFDLGVRGDWNSATIQPFLNGSGGGLSYDLFRYTVLLSPKLRPTVTVTENAAAALKHLANKEGGIAVVPMLPAGQTKLKTLLLARGAADVAFGPTPDNIHNGDYPIRLPLYLVFRKDATKRLLPLLRFLFSEDAVPLWEGAQLVPLPAQARTAAVFGLEAP